MSASSGSFGGDECTESSLNDCGEGYGAFPQPPLDCAAMPLPLNDDNSCLSETRETEVRIIRCSDVLHLFVHRCIIVVVIGDSIPFIIILISTLFGLLVFRSQYRVKRRHKLLRMFE